MKDYMDKRRKSRQKSGADDVLQILLDLKAKGDSEAFYWLLSQFLQSNLFEQVDSMRIVEELGALDFYDRMCETSDEDDDDECGICEYDDVDDDDENCYAVEHRAQKNQHVYRRVKEKRYHHSRRSKLKYLTGDIRDFDFICRQQKIEKRERYYRNNRSRLIAEALDDLSSEIQEDEVRRYENLYADVTESALYLCHCIDEAIDMMVRKYPVFSIFFANNVHRERLTRKAEEMVTEFISNMGSGEFEQNVVAFVVKICHDRYRFDDTALSSDEMTSRKSFDYALHGTYVSEGFDYNRYYQRLYEHLTRSASYICSEVRSALDDLRSSELFNELLRDVKLRERFILFIEDEIVEGLLEACDGNSSLLEDLLQEYGDYVRSCYWDRRKKSQG